MSEKYTAGLVGGITARLEAAEAERDALADELAATIDNANREIARLKAERDALAEQVEDWQAELLAVEPAARRIANGVEDESGLTGSTRAALARYRLLSVEDNDEGP